MTARRLKALLVLAITGCYQTVPLTTATPRAGSEVEARLTDSGSASLTQLAGAQVTSVRGRYVSGSQDSIRLSVLGTTRRDGSENFWNGEQLGISRTDIANLGERKISRPRTGAVIALSVIAASLVKLGFDGRTNTSGTRRPPPPTQ